MKTWIVPASILLLFVACGGSGSEGSTTPEATPVETDGSDDGTTAEAEEPAEEATEETEEAADPAPQIAAGESVWADSCAMCHGDDGAGKKKTPGVVGEGTLSDYSDAAALMAYIHKEMPKDDPGTLDDGQAAAVTAWILSKRGVTLSAPISDENAASMSLQ